MPIQRLAPRLMSTSGVALAEVLVASGVLVVVAAGVAQVIVQSVRAGFSARAATMGAVLTAQKIEQLRSLSWRVTADGVPVSDFTTDLSTAAGSDGGPGLGASPPGTLDENMPPYVDYLDAMGNWAGHGAAPPSSAVYVRRWSVRPLAGDPDILVLQALVTTALAPGDRGADASAIRSRVVTLRSRTR